MKGRLGTVNAAEVLDGTLFDGKTLMVKINEEPVHDLPLPTRTTGQERPPVYQKL